MSMNKFRDLNNSSQIRPYVARKLPLKSQNVLTSAVNCEFKKNDSIFLYNKLHLLHATFETHKRPSNYYSQTDLLRNVGNISINITHVYKNVFICQFTFEIRTQPTIITSFLYVKQCIDLGFVMVICEKKNLNYISSLWT